MLPQLSMGEQRRSLFLVISSRWSCHCNRALYWKCTTNPIWLPGRQQAVEHSMTRFCIKCEYLQINHLNIMCQHILEHTKNKFIAAPCKLRWYLLCEHRCLAIQHQIHSSLACLTCSCGTFNVVQHDYFCMIMILVSFERYNVNIMIFCMRFVETHNDAAQPQACQAAIINPWAKTNCKMYAYSRGVHGSQNLM